MEDEPTQGNDHYDDQEKPMPLYIGAKLIRAEPMQKDGEDGYKVMYPDGYVSWSPKGVFEKAYSLVDMDFL